jgi:mRNA interferase MazF
VLVGLDPTRGHEQRGTRPCVIVSDADVTEGPRFPLLAVVPISSTAGEGAFYPALAPGRSGLRRASHALVDQVRSIDKRRIARVFGRIAPDEMAAIDEGLLLFLGPG